MRTSILELRSVRGTGGGPEKTILVGAERHDPRFSVVVCYLRDLRDDVFGIDDRARQMNVDYVEVLERHSFDPAIWRQLIDLVRSRRIDIVHGHDYKTNLLALLVARRTGAIAIGTSHGWTGRSWRERFIYYPADRRVLRRMPRIIAVSSQIRDQLVASGVAATRVTVLLNGIDPEAFRRSRAAREHARAELRAAPDQYVIGAVGRLEGQKRFDVLLDAIARLRTSRPNILLVVVGDGSERDRLKTRAHALGLESSCQFLGLRLDVARLHCAFDLFVQSSDYEGTPNAVLEAMAMQTPLVATDVGGTRELVTSGVHGLIVPPADPAALAAAIGDAWSNRGAALARATAARQRVERELSFTERTRRLETIYDELIASRHSRAVSPTTTAAGAVGDRGA